MATMMIVNVYQSVAMVNLDQVVEVSPLATGGCKFHFNGDGTRGDGKASHHTVTCTDDFASVVSRLQAANVTFIA